MNEVVKLLRIVFIAFTFVIVLTQAQTRQVSAADEGFSRSERCAGLPGAAPEAPFDGMLVTVDSDATRAYRAGIPTTYVLSFAGGSFLTAGAVSPDGQYYAVPNGIITTISNSDVRYVVQEIRILTTGVVPRIVKRVPWRASFPVGTAFTSTGDIPPIRWLNGSTIRFVSGTISEGQSLVDADVFSDAAPLPAAGPADSTVSLDNSRAVAYVEGTLSLIDVPTGHRVASLPPTPRGALQFSWSPDSSQFATTELAGGAVTLALYDKNGVRLETVAVLQPEKVLWNLRWSPDGKRLAFTAFDPQLIENRLQIVDLESRVVTDTCLPLLADVDGTSLSSLAWSPDGTRLAILTRQAAPAAQIQIYEVAARTRYNLVPAAGRLLGWFP